MTQPSKKRLNYVDMVKGIAILIIILYHLAAPGSYRSFLDHTMESMLLLFFFFSGFFYRPGKKTFAENVKSRAKALLIPFFAYSLVFWAVGTVYLLASDQAPLSETLACLRNFYGGCIWNRTIQSWFGWEYYSLGKRYLFLADFWFLLSLLFAGILFFAIADRVLKSAGKTLAAAGILAAMTAVLRSFAVALPYNLQLVPFWAALLLLGAFAGQYRLFEPKKLSGAREWIAAVAALAAGIALDLLKTPNNNLFRGSFEPVEAVNLLLSLTAALLTGWGLGELCRLAELSGLRVKELAWIGSHSLTFFIYHMFYGWIVSLLTGIPILYRETADTAAVWKSLLLSAVVIVLCAVTALVSDRIRAGIKSRK